MHRKLGLAVLVMGPFLVGSTALMTVHSADRAVVSGEPDMFLVGNVLGTIWLALLLVLAFVLKKRRKVHGALLMSTITLFLGPALFFALIAFAPPFRIEGPETFHRFQTAGMTGLTIGLVITGLMFLRDRRNHWPYLLAAAPVPLGECIKALLSRADMVDAVTRAVAAPGRPLAFLAGFAIVAGLLAVTALPARSRRPLTMVGKATA